MQHRIKKLITSTLNTYKSKKVKDKILVIESDDWGSIRTPSIEAAEKIKALGGYTADSAYLEYDTLESEADLSMLFELLDKYKDRDGNPLVVTANFVMSNPAFFKIEENNFEHYFYEPFTSTYNNYFGSNQIVSLIQNGFKNGIFYPQFHGREHVNIPLWLELLQSNQQIFKTAFDLKFFGVQTRFLEEGKRNIQMTYDLENSSRYLKESIEEGLALFETIFGFVSRSFIPNNYIWNQNWNNVLISNKIQFLQGIRLQTSPLDNNSLSRSHEKRFGGRKEKYGIISIVRNCSFEPSFKLANEKTLIKRCLNEIGIAFLFNQPAVISMHRLNFVSGLDVSNRNKNLELFDELLNCVIKKWPEVRFMNTEQLGNYYNEIED